MLNLHIRPVAAKDIDEIIDYFVLKNTQTAQDFVSELERCFTLLAENPQIGVQREYRPKALAGMSMFPLKTFSSYLVFYMADDQTIDIVRALNGRRDIERLFTEKKGNP